MKMSIALDPCKSQAVLSRYSQSQYPVDLRINQRNELEIWEDSAPTNYAVLLRSDGTWSVITEIELK